jgi:hypothetical protein
VWADKGRGKLSQAASGALEHLNVIKVNVILINNYFMTHVAHGSHPSSKLRLNGGPCACMQGFLT